MPPPPSVTLRNSRTFLRVCPVEWHGTHKKIRALGIGWRSGCRPSPLTLHTTAISFRFPTPSTQFEPSIVVADFPSHEEAGASRTHLVLRSFTPKLPIRPGGVCGGELTVSGKVGPVERTPEPRRLGSSQHHIYLDSLHQAEGRGLGGGVSFIACFMRTKNTLTARGIPSGTSRGTARLSRPGPLLEIVTRVEGVAHQAIQTIFVCNRIPRLLPARGSTKTPSSSEPPPSLPTRSPCARQ